MLTLRRIEDFSSRQEYAARMDGFKGLNMRDDDSVMPLEESPSAENVVAEGGRLRRAAGFDVVKWKKEDGQEVLLRQLPEEIVGLFEFQAAAAETEGYKNLYYTAADGNLYRFVYDAALSRVQAEAVSCADGITGWEYTYFTQYKSGKNNCALLGGPQCGPYVYTEGGGYALIASGVKPHMEKTAMHFSRMFGIGDPEYPQRVWFSKIGDPCDFTSSEEAGGYIDITDTIGSAIDIVSFFDTLLVFCRYGIVAVNTLSVQSDFTVENIFFSDSEILRGSVTVCGDCVLFATRYGVYSCSGSGVACVSHAIKGFFEENKITDNKTSFLSQYSSSNNTYTFTNIAPLITYCIEERKREIIASGGNPNKEEDWKKWESENPDWNKVVLIPVKVESNSNNEVVAISNSLDMESAALKGGTNEKNKLKMQIFYTTF